MTKITRIELATKQLRSAIQLLNRRDYISSLTLAGAAEEILGRIAEKRTGINALISEKLFYEQLSKLIKQASPSREKIIRLRNRVKNELKHNDSGEDDILDHDFQSEAEDLIIAAINNYTFIYGYPPNDRVIKKYWDERT